MTASISRPVPVSFFLQHLTEFGDETQCIVGVRCCPFCSCKLNASFASNWSDTTTGWCYQQHIHSRGIKLQWRGGSCLQMHHSSVYLKHVGAGVIGINTMWMKHHRGPASVKSGHSLVTLYVVHQSFCCVWLCVSMIQYAFTRIYTNMDAQIHTLTSVSSHLFIHHKEEYDCNLKKKEPYMRNLSYIFHSSLLLPLLCSTSIFLPFNKHQLFSPSPSPSVSLSLWLIYRLVSRPPLPLLHFRTISLRATKTYFFFFFRCFTLNM